MDYDKVLAQVVALLHRAQAPLLIASSNYDCSSMTTRWKRSRKT